MIACRCLEPYAGFDDPITSIYDGAHEHTPTEDHYQKAQILHQEQYPTKEANT